MKNILKLFVVVLILLILGLIITLYNLSNIAKHRIIDYSSNSLGRHLTIDDASIDYRNFEIEFKNLTLYDADSVTPFVGFASLVTDAEPFLLFRKEIRFKKLYLDSMFIHFRQESETTFNFTDLMELAGDDHEIEDTTLVVNTSGLPELDGYNLIFEDFRLTRSLISYEDQTIDQYVQVDDVNMELPEFRWDNQKSKVAIDLHFAQGGDATFKLESDLKNESYLFETDLSNVDLAILTPTIKKYSDLNFSEFTGMFNGVMQIYGNPFKPIDSRVSGNVYLENFSFRDVLGKKLVRLDTLRVDVDSLQIEKEKYFINRVHMKNPVIYFSQWEEQGELVYSYTKFLNLSPEPISDFTDESKNVSNSKDDSSYDTGAILDTLFMELQSFHIDSVFIQNGSFHYADSTYSKPLQFSFTHMDANGFLVPTQNVLSTIKANTKVNTIGKSVIDMQLKDEGKEEIGLDFSISNLAASDLTPIFLDLFGRPVESGKIRLKITSELDGEQVRANFYMHLYQLELGKKEKKGEYNIPIKMILSLLEDGKGRIILDVDVEGDPDDPSFDTKKAISRSIKNVLVNVAEAPFNLIGRALGIEEKDLSEIPYTYGVDSISKRRGLNGLVKLAGKKPEVTIRLTQFYNNEQETLALAKELAFNQFVEMDSTFDKNQFLPFLQKKTNIQSDSLELLSLNFIGKSTVESLLPVYREKRNAWLQKFFTEENVADQIVISTISEAELTPAAKLPKYDVMLDFGDEMNTETVESE